MCKYIETVRFCIAQLLYNKRGILQKCLSKWSSISLKVYSSSINAEVEPSLNPADHNFHRGQTG